MPLRIPANSLHLKASNSVLPPRFPRTTLPSVPPEPAEYFYKVMHEDHYQMFDSDIPHIILKKIGSGCRPTPGNSVNGNGWDEKAIQLEVAT